MPFFDPGFPIWRIPIALRLPGRFLVGPTVLTGLALGVTGPWLQDIRAFHQAMLLYGLFLGPLVAIWLTPRLVLSDPCRDLLVTTRYPLWRLALERHLLLLGGLGVLWTLFLGLAWILFGVRHGFSDPVLLGPIWGSGIASLLFFAGFSHGCGCLYLRANTGMLLATGVWLGGIVWARSQPAASPWTPFYLFFRDPPYAGLGIQPWLFGLLAWVILGLGLWRLAHADRIGPEMVRSGFPWHLLVPGSTKGLNSLIGLEWRLLARRRTLWIYVLAPLALGLVLPVHEEQGLAEFLPRLVSNLMAFHLPLCAVFAAPILTRSLAPDRDWMWATPLVWTRRCGAVLIPLASLTLACFALWGIWPLALGVWRGFWSWDQGYYGLGVLAGLLFPSGLVHVLLISGLSLLLRRTLAVIAVSAVLTLGVYLGVLLPAASLLDPRNFLFLSLHFHPLAGIIQDQSLVVRLLGLQLGLGALLWCMGLALLPRRNLRITWTHAGQWQVWAACGGSAGLVLLAGFAYQQVARTLQVPEPVAVPDIAWSVQEVAHRVRLGDHTLEVFSRLQLTSEHAEESPTLALRLNPGLRLQEVRMADQSVAWTRAGEVVYLAWPAVPGVPAEVEVRYVGWPILPREDYAPTGFVNVVGVHPFLNYPQAQVSYADGRYLQWVRDSDWTVWPVSAQVQVASRSNTWEVDLSPTQYSVVLSPEATSRPAGNRIRYVWSDSPPSLLLVAGDYRHRITASGAEVLRGSWQTRQDQGQAEALLDLYQRLMAWWGHPPAAMSQLVYLPYGHRLHVGPVWLAFPSLGTGSVVSAEQSLDLAIRLAEDWLRAEIAWEPVPQTAVPGFALSASLLLCRDPDAHNRQLCISDLRYRPNPQAPHGRLIPEDYCLYQGSYPGQACNGVSPLRRALAITLAYTFLAEEEPIPAAWTRWQQRATIPGWPQFDEELAGWPARRHNPCATARALLTMRGLVERYGETFLRDWIRQMATAHPPGADSTVDTQFWELAADLTGEHPSPADVQCTDVILQEAW